MSGTRTGSHSPKKRQQRPVQRTIEQLRKELLKDHKRLGNWRDVAAEWHLPPGTLCRIAGSDYEPKDAHVRVRLGLPALEPAPVCLKCGEVHVAKRCTKKATKHNDWLAYSVKELRELFANRE